MVPWLALNRGDLVVFIHPKTGDDVADHRDFAVWLGAKLDLDLKGLSA
jgi:DOPA 4,5-dioxygenase